MKTLFNLFLVFCLLGQAHAVTAPQVIPNDQLQIGKAAAGDKTIILNKGSGSANPKIKWNNSTSKLQFSNDGTNYKDMGSGSGGVNLLTLGTTWSNDNPDNSDIEASVGNWTTGADAAATTPVDLTGGTASFLTQSRTTISGEVLNGTGSLKIVKSANNAQGQFTSCLLNVPPAYQSKNTSIQIPFRVTSGSIVQGDVKVFIYDVTNSILITPFNNDIVGTTGTISAVFPTTASASTPANQQYRIGIYFASTSATAVTLVFDDIKVSPDINPYGQTTTSRSYLAFLNSGGSLGIGTVSKNTLQGEITVTNPTTKRLLITAVRKVSVEATVVAYQDSGGVVSATSITPYYNGVSQGVIPMEVNNSSSSTYPTFQVDMEVGDTIEYKDEDTNTISGRYVSIRTTERTVSPITQSTTFKISNYLANGTRVTTTPVALGEYRSYQKGASSTSGTDTAPNTVPSTANGIALGAFNYATAGSGTFNISRYEIFIGKNKTYLIEGYSGTGRTGTFNIDQSQSFASVDAVVIGTNVAYDPTTGVLFIDAIAPTSSVTNNNLGVNIPTAGGARSAITTAYFDVIVSEPAIPIQVGAIGGTIYLDGGNGRGSTNTTVRRFTTQQNIDSSLYSYTDSATLGMSVTILQDGVYSIVYGDRTPSTAGYWGISIDGTGLTTAPASLTYAQGKRAIVGGGANGSNVEATYVDRLRAGQVVRAQLENATGETSASLVYFSITKVGN
jgi:hypothetical protein